MGQRRVRQEQVAVGEAGVNSFSGRVITDSLHLAADRAVLGGAGSVDITMDPGFADVKSYAVTVSFDGGAAAAAPAAIAYTSGTQFTISFGIAAAGRTIRWMAIGARI